MYACTRLILITRVPTSTRTYAHVRTYTGLDAMCLDLQRLKTKGSVPQLMRLHYVHPIRLLSLHRLSFQDLRHSAERDWRCDDAHTRVQQGAHPVQFGWKRSVAATAGEHSTYARSALNGFKNTEQSQGCIRFFCSNPHEQLAAHIPCYWVSKTPRHASSWTRLAGSQHARWALWRTVYSLHELPTQFSQSCDDIEHSAGRFGGCYGGVCRSSGDIRPHFPP